MDKIFVTNLRVDCFIGLYDWEKQNKQPLYFDIEVTTSIISASKSDCITHTLNYSSLSDDILTWTVKSNYDLLETLAENLCQHLLERYSAAKKIKLTIRKPQAVLEADYAGIQICRRQKTI